MHPDESQRQIDEICMEWLDTSEDTASAPMRFRIKQIIGEQKLQNRELQAKLAHCETTLSIERSQAKSMDAELQESNRLIDEWRKCGEGLKADIMESLAQEGMGAGDTPASHYSPSYNRLLELLKPDLKRKCDMTGPCDEGHVCGEGQDRVCWFLEVDKQSKAACSVCKDLVWPRWYSKGGSYLTDDPNEAMQFKTRDDALRYGGPNHFHLYPTEHVFVSR